jgi:hypothetical protein
MIDSVGQKMAHITTLINGSIDGSTFRIRVTILGHGQIVLRQVRALHSIVIVDEAIAKIEYSFDNTEKMVPLNPELPTGDSIQSPINADQDPESSRSNRPRKCLEQASQ